MLQDIRANVGGPFTKVVVVLIVLAFALFGVENILLGGGNSGMGEVNGEEISLAEYQMGLNTQQRRLMAMMGDNFDPNLVEEDRLRAQVLESIVQRKLQIQLAEKLGLAVSEEELGRVVGSMEQFQIDGVFDPALYKNLLSELRYTPTYFKQTLREDLLLNQLRSGIAGSDFATRGEQVLGARIGAEQRDLRYLTIPLAQFLAQEVPGEEDIQAYYEAHQDDFFSAETVELEYIELLSEDFFRPVEEEQLLEAYEIEISGTAYSTENRVSHILLTKGADETDQALEQRLAQAQAELASGTAFAEVAQKYSDDFGSVDAGGDLGFSAGEAFPPEMEAAISELDINVASDVVETDAGLHLIMVTERREGDPPTLAELRPQLEQQLQEAEARAELLQTVEDLRNISFNAEDLTTPAEELGLTLQRSGAVGRDQQEGLFARPALLSAAFSEEVVDGGLNSEVIELGPGHFVVLRLVKYNEPQVRPLELVAGRIASIIGDEAARRGVKQAAEQAVVSLREGERVEDYANSKGYAWQVELGARRRNPNVPPEVLQRAFQLPNPEGDTTLIDYVTSAQGDALVLELDRVTTGEYGALPKPEQQLLQRQLTSEYASMLDSEYRSGLRTDADVRLM
jgi:peptidyl-prolyl cis-trans isomerase D